MSPATFINVIIADSQFLVVETLKQVLGEDERFMLAGVAGTQSDLMNLLGTIGQGLLIADVFAIGFTGLDDLKIIIERYPEIKVLVLTNAITKAEFQALTKLGIKNVIYKNVDKDELLACLQATLKGKKFYSEEIIDLYLDLNESKYVVDEPKSLTVSEIEIVRMIANGLTTKEIASKRNISLHTVSTHRKNIFKKVNVSSASELIIYAIKAGWIDNIEYYI